MKPNFVNLVLIVPFEVLNPINSVLVADIGLGKKTGCPVCWDGMGERERECVHLYSGL